MLSEEVTDLLQNSDFDDSSGEDGSENYVLIPTPRGGNLLMWRGYTYSEMTGKYICSAYKSRGCKARLKLDRDGKIVLVQGEHYHDPPNYFKTHSGNYVKLYK
ncbi:Modifier of mdg4 [Operophtera brumata]|uniref:Modifier of mdg4 n=1 Tax=Operophtera brumata TaxID=104452 RepID=A0A0L7KT96_OPEBR|nr:Modifier of mdg4 [Operophtera brumata]